MHLGTKIKIARLSKGLTQQDLAEKINKTRPLVSHVEQTGKVNHQTLMLMSKALEMNLEDIEGIVNEPLKRGKAKTRTSELQDEVERLKDENATLKELVKSQKEVIEMLKAKSKK